MAPRRISRDVARWRLRDILDLYGAPHEARVDGAPQPGDPGPPHPGGQDDPHPGMMAAGAPQAAAKAAAAPAFQPTGTVGASQPGGSPSEGSVFLTLETLRRQCPQLHLTIERVVQLAIERVNGSLSEGSVCLTLETLRSECPQLHLTIERVVQLAIERVVQQGGSAAPSLTASEMRDGSRRGREDSTGPGEQ